MEEHPSSEGQPRGQAQTHPALLHGKEDKWLTPDHTSLQSGLGAEPELEACRVLLPGEATVHR